MRERERVMEVMEGKKDTLIMHYEMGSRVGKEEKKFPIKRHV